ncbi:ATP-binding cassette-type vacuolar membrane transporter-like protein Hmt1 [Corynespora cassiicola Philippines]|uniref:ATP-binding cassette-type vacuolar membrane transporter-like protein Hmt1 n=1 Tax=Corynespora cassiicola Philippines TaxID=1448308 RepID=A0A2T2PCV9_CORCC|nr:ATP-binding cassette-type vacuolar membrane transporter-like protein Hmt1 [Corynespora cassiicola Philippines]
MAMELLDYMHAPAMGLYFFGAFTYGIVTLQKPKRLPLNRKRTALALIACLLTGFVAELLYYLSRSFAELQYQAPQHAAIRCLGSILVWIPLSSSLYSSESARWHPYFGAIAMQFVFETATCILQGLSIRAEDRFSNIPLSIAAFRGFASLLLLIDGFLILVEKKGEKGTDEEEQSLLGNQSNGAATSNAQTTYGAIDTGSDDGDDSEPEEPNKEMKELQAKRLAEAGGWVGYVRSFAIFLPYLWPKDDWRIMGCLFLRFLYLVQGRFLNILTPRQIGIITQKLAEGATTIPWKDIGLWTLYSWVNSFAGFGIIDSFADTYVSNQAYTRITLLAYKHLMGLSMDFHTNKDSGEVLKAVEQASSLNTLIELVLFEVCPIFVDLIVSMYYVTHLFDAYMAFMILFMGLVYIWVGIFFSTRAQKYRRTYVERQRTENTTVDETVHNWQTVAYFNRAQYELDRYGTNIRNTISAHYSYYFRSYGGHAAQDMVRTIGFAGCCIFAIYQIIYGGKTVGNLVTFIMYWGTMTGPLYTMSYSYKWIAGSLIDAERLVQLLNTKPSVSDAPDATDLKVKTGTVNFKKVQFAYDERKPIIKDITFEAQGGQTVAFVGETGGGKSTILKLLFRFYDVTNGSIEIDGQDLRSVTLSSVRDAMGVVPQDPTLFNQTIRQNVRYARLDATDAEIEDACRAAAIHADITSFPDGYASKVGERGVKLSGGQLQRLAIARVLLKNPKIVLLDEATSAVDSATESLIQDAFRKLSRGRTTFVIAHRLSTVVHADQILVVDKGEVVERGTHAELLALKGRYAELWGKQTASGGPGTETTEQGMLIDVAPVESEAGGAATGAEVGDGAATKRK